jgi:hypothetical protein
MKHYKFNNLIIVILAVILVSALSIIIVNQVMADVVDNDTGNLSKEEYLEQMSERYDNMNNYRSVADMSKDEYIKMNEEMYDLREKYGVNTGMHGMMGGGMMRRYGGCHMMGW